MTRSVTRMGIQDAEHYTPEQRAAIIASYPEHERQARIEGLPAMGEGAVFAGVNLEDLFVDDFPIPRDWVQIGGLDFGWDHPSAATKLAWDRDADVVYVTREWAARQTTPGVAAIALKPWGEWLPWAWPHDGLQHDKGSGQGLADQYRETGLALLHEHATHEAGGFGLEAGILEMVERMLSGRWLVFRSCVGWMGEARTYHRKNGQIVKLVDDRISSSRIGLMMLRFARTKPSSDGPRKRGLKGVVV